MVERAPSAPTGRVPVAVEVPTKCEVTAMPSGVDDADQFLAVADVEFGEMRVRRALRRSR